MLDTSWYIAVLHVGFSDSYNQLLWCLSTAFSMLMTLRALVHTGHLDSNNCPTQSFHNWPKWETYHFRFCHILFSIPNLLSHFGIKWSNNCLQILAPGISSAASFPLTALAQQARTRQAAVAQWHERHRCPRIASQMLQWWSPITAKGFTMFYILHTFTMVNVNDQKRSKTAPCCSPLTPARGASDSPPKEFANLPVALASQ